MGKDTAYWFSHDYNSRTDEKTKALIRKHGMLGYGIFWAIVEDLYNNANALRLDCEGIAFDMRVDESIVESVLNDFDLFFIQDGVISSKSVQRRLDERKEKSVKASKSANKRWANANALQTQSDGNAIKEKKGDEKKEKEIKGLATLDEVLDFYMHSLNLMDYPKHAEEFFNKMQTDNWTYKGKPIDNWRSLAYAFIKNIKLREGQQMIECPNVNGYKKIFIYAKSDIKMHFNPEDYKVIK